MIQILPVEVSLNNFSMEVARLVGMNCALMLEKCVEKGLTSCAA